MAIDVSVREISTVKYRIYRHRHVIKDPIQIDINSLCTIPELWYLKFFPDVPGSDKCRRYHLFYTLVSIESVTNGCLAFFIFLYRLSIPLRDEIAASSAKMSTTTFPGQAHLVQVVYVWKMRRVSGVNSNQRSHAAPGS